MTPRPAWPTTNPTNAGQTIPVSTEEVSARLTPLPFLSIMGTASRTTSTGRAGCAADVARHAR